MKKLLPVFLVSLFLASCSASWLKDEEISTHGVWPDRKPAIVEKATGKVITSTSQFSTVGDYHEGLCLVKQFDPWKYGYLDTSWKLSIPFQFDEAGNFSEWLAWFKKSKTYGYIDKDGDTVFSFDDFTKVWDFHDWLAQFSKWQTYGFINKDGEIAFTFEGKNYEPVWDFSNGILLVWAKGNNNKIGAINKKWELITPVEYWRENGDYLKEWQVAIYEKDKITKKIRRGTLISDGTIQWRE
jgi:hypothetical protein